MTKHEAPSEPVTHSDYDKTSEEKLRYARSATGWGILVFAAAAIVPSVYDGLSLRQSSQTTMGWEHS